MLNDIRLKEFNAVKRLLVHNDFETLENIKTGNFGNVHLLYNSKEDVYIIEKTMATPSVTVKFPRNFDYRRRYVLDTNREILITVQLNEIVLFGNRCPNFCLYYDAVKFRGRFESEIYILDKLYKTKDFTSIILEYGHTTLKDFLKKEHSEESWVSILIQILYTLAFMKTKLRLAHKDLHWNNILLRPINTYEEFKKDEKTHYYFEYKYKGKSYKVRVKYLVLVIDFGLSLSPLMLSLSEKEVVAVDELLADNVDTITIFQFMNPRYIMSGKIIPGFFIDDMTEKDTIDNITGFLAAAKKIDKSQYDEVEKMLKAKIGEPADKMELPVAIADYLAYKIYAMDPDALTKLKAAGYTPKGGLTYYPINNTIYEHFKEQFTLAESMMPAYFSWPDSYKFNPETLFESLLEMKSQYVVSESDVKILEIVF